MSCPAFAWALERGATLKLLASDRLVLIYLADMANGEMVCWPSQETIVRWTGLALRTVREALHRLDARQLIRVESSAGCLPKYHILRPITPANGSGVTGVDPGRMSPTTPANGNGEPRQNVPTYPGKSGTEPRQMVPKTPADRIPDPSTTQERDPRARAPAREGRQDFQIREAGKQAAAPPPMPPALVPVPAATRGGTDLRSSDAFLDDPSPNDALPCEIEQEVIHADLPDPDGPPPPGAFQALIASIASGFQNNYPARAPNLSPSEMIDLCEDTHTIKPNYLAGHYLAAARKQAGIRHANA